MDVDIGDMRPSNSLFGPIGCGGPLQLHVPSAKFPIHYLVGSETLIFLPDAGNGILNRDRTKLASADTIQTPKCFCEPTSNQKIAIHEPGGDGVGRGPE